MNTKKKILELLRSGPKTDAEISTAISVPVPTVRRCRGELVRAGLVESARQSGHGRGGLVFGSSTWRLATVTKASDKKSTKKFTGEPKSRPPEARPPGGTVWF